MDKIYTDFTLIRFIYKETDLAERFEVEDAIENDKTIRTAFIRLYKTYKSLPKVLFRPSRKSIENVLIFSNNYSA